MPSGTQIPPGAPDPAVNSAVVPLVRVVNTPSPAPSSVTPCNADVRVSRKGT